MEVSMNAFQITRHLVDQGADRARMAATLESLHNAGILPTWGEGQTGAELTARQIGLIVLGATAPNPASAAEHVGMVARLRGGDSCLRDELTKILEAETSTNAVVQLEVSDDGRAAVIRYPSGSALFGASDGPRAFRQSTTIHGSLLGAIAVRLHHPPESGWSENPK
jgi:hypothetical protein